MALKDTLTYVETDTKPSIVHDEKIELESGGATVVDNEAGDYIDASVVIDEATNKRLRRMINKRYANRLAVWFSVKADPYPMVESCLASLLLISCSV